MTEANRLCELERTDIRFQVSHTLLEARDAIQAVFRSETPMTVLEKVKRDLQAFRQIKLKDEEFPEQFEDRANDGSLEWK